MNGAQIIINVRDLMGDPFTPPMGAPSICTVELESPVHIPGAGALSLLASRPNDPMFQQLRNGLLQPAVVQNAGHRLFQELTANPAIQNALTYALQQPHGINPVYIHIRSEDAEELPWEALCAPSAAPPYYRFLSLDDRNPIARTASSVVPVGEVERFMEQPLRVAVVLSAVTVPADTEWMALKSVFLQTGRDVDLMVMVGDEDFGNQLRASSGLDPRVTVRFVPQFGEELIDRIRQFAPNIVHFFCHGSTEGGPHLQIANVLDWQMGSVGSSIHLDVGDLERIDPYRRYTWLVTLNCCLGAVPIEQAPSLARALVQRGFPAAVGMREVLSSLDAPVFCRQFYEAILTEIDDRLAIGNRHFEINWAKLLPRPRRFLHQHRAGGPPPLGPEQLKEWTLPVLYVSRDPFRLRRPSNNLRLSRDERRRKQNELTEYKARRAELARLEAPDAALTKVDSLIDALEIELYPDD